MPDVPARFSDARSGWANTGAARPPFATEPELGQESVWDYPRPPVIVADRRRVEVGDQAERLARTERAVRVLETAGPPTWYLPPDDVRTERLVRAEGSSFCEWKGSARYWAHADAPGTPIAWDYPEPLAEFAALAGFVSFYPGRVPCWVDDERVRAQPGGFYGGWITDEIVGPFKGDRGTSAW